jgi:ATP-dependent helicase HrpB
MRWLDPPDEVSVRRSLALLGDLGAMDNRTGAITPMGKRLLAFPVHPRIARMLLAGHDLGCAEEAALAAALAQEGGLHLPRQNRDIAVLRERRLPGPERERSDFGPLLRSWRYASERNFDPAACRELGISDSVARRVARLYEQFRRIAADEGLGRGADTGDTDALAKCILTGFADQVGVRIGGDARRYALVHGRRATLDRDSAVAGAAMVVAAEIHEIGQSDGLMEVRLGLATAVEQEWLASLFPGALSEVRHVRYDASEKRVVTVRELRFRDLVIESRRGPDPHPSEAAKLLAGEVLAGNLTLKHWDHAVEQWILRVNLVAEWYPESGVAPIDEAARQTIVEQVCLGGVGYRDIKDRSVWPAVRAWLSGALHAEVERMAPERLNLPNGRSPKVTYAKGGPPAISLRVQELYGVNRPLTVAGGRVRVVVHVLAPNFRPVQVTDDLASFWQNAYPAIRKEYQRKYPKHEWRERGDR